MIFISEAESAALISHELAYDAVREALLAASEPEARSFPVVHGQGSDPGNTFSIKASATRELAGLKVGSFWPGNPANGLPRHNSLILLFDQQIGKMAVAIEAGKVNAFRTAAADAVAADLLARPDASVLAVFGTGHQARYECAALARIRPIRTVLIVGRDSGKSAEMAQELKAAGLDAQVSDAESACRAADIIVTATPSRAPLFNAEWVKAGTHVVSMGSDAAGKQELPPELFTSGRLFCDLPSQSRTIGEFQHAPAHATLTAIGDVISENATGRQAPDDITIFDSSGLSIQDLYIGQRILAVWQAEKQNGGIE
ncbi:ornithine cyclodeaminase family protein [Pectobacterium atrosepticum]|uniref:ornithine cyclodeaminase family protein n=1 Tax=Pectobacterium atrosepticum TaxID=29471 RepID=UPI0003A0F02C|nr:ornithine cyclodeaminase family protein [Pectobacterium atrosepticum]GKV83864.1 ornithine cyclodeaminase [Pectobacterium carotovorum subsp. carotovorum]AIA70871.1 ornithine cyclodeaminase [Pectobacterium atrosepticum]AIK14356.1 Ornithine cyclodeaminase [Pectobacterium atrosepticum]ATY91109.1 ornithine cyclodeaminase family protein [Pectobacterium atrosepticum]KFX12980.1 ornithine cyclodeaminase [Pectobacterium atrosepticum]